ncbi:hypothetical protein MO867_13580 [Microbulbifer sp. OS29]|uniref:Peptidase n=1 Tax=Microbulbifer okhotskensis TaxID=2926617 RepID=A0A9X2EPD9_9GAMM|nr:hypothetical protein [Microbulbifer okhotskensis]MCO1335364.1 hypothetical protein [Microbulbifer okhotskensis]
MNLEIFKPGTFTDVSGKTRSFSQADIQSTKDAYNPAVFRAPLVVGHPKVNDPAYGWVSSLDFAGSVLTAEPDQVEAEFAEMVNTGRFPKISASFFHPQSANNPVPGVWYLRHVGFLGAAAPAVKGLKEASFADDGKDIFTVEFAGADFADSWLVGRLMRNLRDWMLTKFGDEDADKVVTDWMARDAEQLAETSPSPDFAQPNDKDTPTPQPEELPVDDDKDKAASFADRESALQTQQAQLEAREQKVAQQEAAAREKDIASFADQLVDSGKLLPRERNGIVALMAGLADTDALSFAEGDGTVEKSAPDFLRDFLYGLPTRVDFAERSAAEDETTQAASFAAPTGYSVNQDKLALHNKALSYQSQHKCDYNTALAAVS